MTDVLIAYATTHGHTARIADRLASVLSARGLRVDERRLPDDDDPVDPAGYDAVLALGSIHGGSHQVELTDWLQRHRTTLGMRPSAFVSVSLTAADDADESREATQRYVDELVEGTEWTPDRVLRVAGALQYGEYSFVTRLVARLIAARSELPTDIERDVDLTDWDEVERFGERLADAWTEAVAARGA